MNDRLKTNDVVGILGGGQLGRMLSVAASRLGLRTHVFDPTASPPAADVAHRLTTASYKDEKALTTFAKSVSVITYEFENIPTTALNILEQHAQIRPSKEALSISQDRLAEKLYLNNLGLNTAPFKEIGQLNDLQEGISELGTPSILKTRRFGYDGKGQIMLSENSNLKNAFQKLASRQAILEGFVTFSKEISVIGARSASGEISCFDPGENIHKNGILYTTTVPAKLTVSQRTDAILITGQLMNALEYGGVIGVEIFVTDTGLVVNEIAPRVHNSGHWTQNGCAIDQFEQHIRAIASWPLGEGNRHSNVRMENLIGSDIEKVERLKPGENIAVHVYGKRTVKPGRKMGHINHISSRN